VLCALFTTFSLFLADTGVPEIILKNTKFIELFVQLPGVGRGSRTVA